LTSTYEDRTLLATDVAIKAPCRAATTANITLSGLQTIDGIVLVANDRVLVKNQTSGADNGIYLVSSGSWTRTSDFTGNRTAVDGTMVLVRLGTASALSIYELSCATSPANIGTTSLTFNLVSVVVGNAGSFTTLTVSGQITSSLATGTAPLVIASTTKVANLNVDLLDGTDWRAPGVIGGTTPAAAAFTTLDISNGAGGQVSFPAVQNASAGANVLDDYAETAWTPTLGGSATYTVQEGTRRKIGGLVFVRGRLAVNAIGTGSTAIISGLTDTAAITSVITVAAMASSVTNVVSIAGRIDTGTKTIILVSRTAASAGDSQNAIFQNGTDVSFAGCYHT
jgi:hypothetical protein